MPRQNLVYGLVDPRTRLVRYIGLSTYGMKRPLRHKAQVKAGEQSRKANWIRNLWQAGADYEVVTLETASSRQVLVDAERWWIAYGRGCGWPLTNLTDGGEGCLGRTYSAETLAKMSASAKGRKPSPLAIANSVAARKGKKIPPEIVEKSAAARRGKKLSPEHVAKMSAARLGKKLSAEHRTKIVTALRARPPVSDNTRAKCREAAFKRWGRPV